MRVKNCTCGKAPVIRRRIDGVRVVCKHCQLRTARFENVAEALDAWNWGAVYFFEAEFWRESKKQQEIEVG